MIEFIKKIIIDFLLFLGIISENDIENKQKKQTIYIKKKFMSACEEAFYNKIKELEIDYKIVPQLNLATITNKINNNRYHNDLFRNIDFAIFSKDYKEILLLIELNDKTHQTYKRKDRDLKVKKICNDIGVKLITFYTIYPNEKDYVINRIKTEINNHAPSPTEQKI